MYLSKNYREAIQGTIVLSENNNHKDFYISQKELIIDCFMNYIMKKGGDMNDVVNMYNKIPTFLAANPFYNLEFEIIESGIEFKNELFIF